MTACERSGTGKGVGQVSGDGQREFVDCPECGFPAMVEHRFSVASTEGPVTHAVTLCVQLHRLRTAEEVAVPEPRVQPGAATDGPRG